MHHQNSHQRQSHLRSSALSSSSSSTGTRQPFEDPFVGDDPFAEAAASLTSPAAANTTGPSPIRNGGGNGTNIVGPDGINADEGIDGDIVQLPSAWRFWVQFPAGKPDITDEEYRALFRVVFEFRTVQGFWRCYNSTIKHSIDPTRPFVKETNRTYHLMRKINDTQIKPMWEDSENINGGQWTMRVNKSRAAEVWLHLMLAVIGDQLTDDSDDPNEICGVSASERALDYVFQVWTKSNSVSDAFVKRVTDIVEGGEKKDRSAIRTQFFRTHKVRTHQ